MEEERYNKFSSEKKTRRKRKARRPIREVLLFLVDYQIIIPRRMRTFPRVRQNGMFLVAGDFYLVWGLRYFLTRWNSSQTGNYDCTSSLALLCSARAWRGLLWIIRYFLFFEIKSFRRFIHVFLVSKRLFPKTVV